MARQKYLRRFESRRAGALGAATAGAGAALVATVASACCVGPVVAPLIVAVLGASGAAWAAGLQPYSPYLLAGSFVMLAYGFYAVYRRQPACADGGCPARPSSGLRMVLWLAAALWTASAAVNVWTSIRGF